MFQLRPATLDDAPFLLALRNDEEVRRQSRSPEEVGEAEHDDWLRSRLQEGERCRLYVACVDGEPVGQARLDVDSTGAAEISIALTAPQRGRGLGTALVSRASEQGSRDLGVHRVTAVVRAQNKASYQAFLRAGYVATGAAIGDLPGALRLSWERGA
jgi:RimJ/RimL family protein N-acetyltransferase